jgi:peptide/nickel transport system substrate-binding protein
MNEHGGVVTFFIFLFLTTIVLLQVYSMVQSDRFYRALDCLDAMFEDTRSVHNTKDRPGTVAESDEGYPGDQGDWLVWAFRVEPKTLNQFSADSDVYSRWITVPYIFEPLLVYDFDDLTMRPWLAESRGISDDGLEITFQLRDDVFFSDGRPVTADDVLFTYETAINPEIGAAGVAGLYVNVEKVIKVDGRVVKFVMKRPYFKALEDLSFWDFRVLPKHIYEFSDAEEFNKRVSNPVGSGPFVFEKWIVGQTIVLRRNDNYWGCKPRLKKIAYKFILNPVAAVQALRSHEVDIIIPEPEQFADLARDEQFSREFYCLSYWNPGVPFYYIDWNQSTVFFKDKRVRRAMTHITNREQIVDSLLEACGRTITGPFYVNGPQNDPDIEPWSYNLERAKELLDEAGWIDRNGDCLREKDGTAFRFKLIYSNSYALYDRLAKLLKDEMARVGVEVVPEPCEWSILMGRLNDRKFEANMAGWAGGILEDPYRLWHSSQIGNRGLNYVGFVSPEADAIIEKVRCSLNENKRHRLCRWLHRILHEQQPYTFLFTRPTFRLLDKRFKNVNIYKLGLRYWEWYVPKEQQRYK